MKKIPIKLTFPFVEKDCFREGMVLVIDEIGFNTDTQEMEMMVSECEGYDDL